MPDDRDMSDNRKDERKFSFPRSKPADPKAVAKSLDDYRVTPQTSQELFHKRLKDAESGA